MRTALIVCGIIFMAAISFPQEKTNNDQKTADSTAIKITDKISFYEEQLKQNKEVIQKLESELEERKKLNERLSGAILACRELIKEK